MTRYGYIGLGDMGSAMAENLIRNSSDVTVYDINPEAVQEAVQHGATAATSPADVAQQSDVISICVPADEHIAQVLTGPEGVIEAANYGKSRYPHPFNSASRHHRQRQEHDERT